MKRIKMLPKEIEQIRRKALGQAPKLPMPAPARMAAKKEALVQDSLATLAGLEKMVRSIQAEHGHMFKMDPDRFDRIRAGIQAASDRIDRAVGKAEKAIAKGEETRKGVAAALHKFVLPEHLAAAGVDPDNLSLVKPVNPWHDRGFPLVAEWRWNLDLDRKAKGVLHGLGFRNDTIRRHWMGWNPEDRQEDPLQWGLPGEAGPIRVPAGLVLPRFLGPVLNRILFLPGDGTDSGRGVLMRGSEESPLVLGAEPGSPLVRVADDLQALFMEQEVGDFCHIVVLPGPDAPLPKEAEEATTDDSVFFIILPAESGASKQEREQWARAFPAGTPLHLPHGETVFEARRRGLDLRQWILEALPPEAARAHRVTPFLPEPGASPSGSPLEGLAIPVMDIKGLVDSLMKEIRAAHLSRFGDLFARQKEAETLARKAIGLAGPDPDEFMISAADAPQRSFSEIGRQMAQEISAQREQLHAAGDLTPELEQKLRASEERVLQMGRDGDAQYRQGMEKIEEGKKKLQEARAKAKAGEMPDGAKEKLLAAGLDPDRIRRRTRDEVIDMHARGESLSMAILSGLDLSGLDLSGIDLHRAQCKKTNFSGTGLEGADLSGVLADQADFTGARLGSAVMEGGLFRKAIFKKADLGKANLQKVMAKEADFSEADLTGARLNQALLQNTNLSKACLKEATAEMALFAETRAVEADFSRARLIKCLFKRTVMDRAVFGGAVLNSTMMQGVTGEAVSFAGANMDRSRIAGGAKLAGADFRNTTMREACFRDSDLSASRFEGCVMESALIENCDLSEAAMFRVSAKHTRFNKSNLEAADLRAVNLFMGSLRKARLVRTDLRLSNLYAVDFFKSVLGKTQFEQANLKMTQLLNRTDLLK